SHPQGHQPLSRHHRPQGAWYPQVKTGSCVNDALSTRIFSFVKTQPIENSDNSRIVAVFL
ncbi:MAG: hypothetical protein MRZ38_02210, partial [Muribaculaceae bacterium]|nr:hypothetical protein [Muribaculaceae bacterium]